MKSTFMLVASVLLAGCPTQSRTTVDEDLQGLWQFPGRGVWIRINADGSAFQCRVAPNNELIVASGRFTKPGSIVWDKEWGRDGVSVVADGIRLDGKFGSFTFVRAAAPMSNACLTAEAEA
jgi:hypothetical protein